MTARTTLAASLRQGVDEYGAWYRDYYTGHLDDETRPFPIDPVGPRVDIIPGVGIVTSGADAAGRELPVTSTTGRSPCRKRRMRSAASARSAKRRHSRSSTGRSSGTSSRRRHSADELAGRIALITGGASGIGRATARLLAARGAHVVVADLNADGAREVADELVATHGTRRALAVEVDVTSEAQVDEMFRRTVLEYGGLDFLVASAGLATSASVIETSWTSGS